MVIWKLPAEVSSWVTALIQVLHRRLTWRLVRLLVGLLFDQGRKTVSSWIRAVAIGGESGRSPIAPPRCVASCLPTISSGSIAGSGAADVLRWLARRFDAARARKRYDPRPE